MGNNNLSTMSRKQHHAERHNQRKFRTRARTADIDQVHMALKSGLKKLENQGVPAPESHELPGSGDFYCSHCARHFISQDPLDKHLKSKVHKRRLKDLKLELYTQASADAAIGRGTDNGSRTTKKKAVDMEIV